MWVPKNLKWLDYYIVTNYIQITYSVICLSFLSEIPKAFVLVYLNTSRN